MIFIYSIRNTYICEYVCVYTHVYLSWVNSHYKPKVIACLPPLTGDLLIYYGELQIAHLSLSYTHCDVAVHMMSRLVTCTMGDKMSVVLPQNCQFPLKWILWLLQRLKLDTIHEVWSYVRNGCIEVMWYTVSQHGWVCHLWNCPVVKLNSWHGNDSKSNPSLSQWYNKWIMWCSK